MHVPKMTPALSLLAFLTLGLANARAGDADDFEYHTDRYGNDYSIFNVPPNNPGSCQYACETDQHCQAWSYESSNSQRPNGVCWLKNPAPPPSPKGITTSGVIRARLGQANATAFVNPTYNGYRLDWCRIFENDCGAPAADAFCKSQGFSGVRAFEFQGGMDVPTMTVSQNSVCDPKWHGCDSFASISCQ